PSTRDIPAFPHDALPISFYMKQDIVPGEDNVLQVTPDREGTFAGRCAEMCGAYHNRMLFDVEIVSQDEYDAYIAELREDPEQQGDRKSTRLNSSHGSTPY